MTTGRINQVTTIRETDFFVRSSQNKTGVSQQHTRVSHTHRSSVPPEKIEHESPSLCFFLVAAEMSLSRVYVWNTHTRVRIKKQFTQICDSSVDDLQSHNRSPDQSDQDSCTPESSTLFYHVVLSLVSPLLDGPFLISPSRHQNTTSGDSHTRTRWLPSRICPPVQLWPHGCLRDAYEARSPLSSTRKKLEKSPSLKISQPVYPQVGLQYISTHRVSTYDPLARRSTPSLDSRQAPDSLHTLRHIYIVIHMHTPRPSPGLWSPLSLTHIRMV